MRSTEKSAAIQRSTKTTLNKGHEMIADTTEPRNQRDVTWVTFERPVGRVPLPAWVKDVHVNWRGGFSNGPDRALRACQQ